MGAVGFVLAMLAWILILAEAPSKLIGAVQLAAIVLITASGAALLWNVLP